MVFQLGHDCALLGYTGPRKTWANEMNAGMKHAPGAASITRSVGLQSSALLLCYGCPQSGGMKLDNQNMKIDR